MEGESERERERERKEGEGGLSCQAQLFSVEVLSVPGGGNAGASCIVSVKGVATADTAIEHLSNGFQLAEFINLCPVNVVRYEYANNYWSSLSWLYCGNIVRVLMKICTFGT